MLDELNCAELDELHVELLPARTVMTVFAIGGDGGDGGDGGIAVAVNAGNVNFDGDQNNVAYADASGGDGGDGGDADATYHSYSWH